MSKSMLKKTIFPAFLVAGFALFLSGNGLAANQVQEVDRIIAVVGKEAITLSELKERLQSAVTQLQRQGTPLPPEDILTRQMLERMIIDRAQIQEARDLGLAVDDQQLEQEIAYIAARNSLTLEQFKETLEKENIPYARFREDIRDDITISRLRNREIESRITISEAEIDNFLTQMSAIGEQALYRVAHILLRAPESASPEVLRSLRAKAESVLKRAKNNENFAELAAAYSDAADALQGGDMEWRPLDRLPLLYAETAAKLPVDGVSDLLQSPNGFHIIKLLEKQGGTSEIDGNVRQTHARHILIRANEIVSETEAKRRLEDLRERLKHGEDFGELARLFSQDGSAASGGDLGWVNPGDFVPEFERAMDVLQEGEVSPVVQSPFGFHIIRVEGRRVQDMSQEKQRFAARQALRERKLDEAYQDWLRQLRDRTYVEYRLEEE
jgi:peptidyl-prolyl cis-trans isomerase SurA